LQYHRQRTFMHDTRTPPGPRGRGAADNPPNRFESVHLVADAGSGPQATSTELIADASRTIIARNDSPDVPFDASINPYRGCEHGCSYCYARPSHEYLGFSAGLDFETRIVVKYDAAALLRRQLTSPRWRPEVLAMSGVTDPYQPVERKLGITRACLEVLAEFRNPVAIVTKNELVTRDIDLLGELAGYDAATVMISVTTLDDEVAGAMEPRTSRPGRRLAAIERLVEAGIPCGVLVAPVVPGLNDHEIPSILSEAAARGASSAGYVLLRLPGVVEPIFDDWLRRAFPGRRSKILERLRDLRNGRLNDSRTGVRMRGEGQYAHQISAMFRTGARRAGLNRRGTELSTAAFRRPGQLDLFAG
jgi:DNA repair photolyase